MPDDCTGPDLRTALATLKTTHELSEVAGEVDWDRELGTLTREVLRRKGPALLFTNIRGYNHPERRSGRLATSLLASQRRISLMLGFPDEVCSATLIQHVLQKNSERIPPQVVPSGPVQSVIWRNGIDLAEFPVPRWHHLDGGRYINTFAAVVTKDPENGRVNVGVYRGMLAGPDRIAVLLIGGQHWGQHWAKYRARGENMPVACVYGWHPVMEFVAGSPLPATTPEYEVMGAYLGQPVQLVRCQTVDLEVPAAAEIVVEGEISSDPKTFAWEGPFGEFTGYVSDVPALRPVIQVRCVTHRWDPIFRGTLEGSLPGASGENSHMSSLQRSAIAWNILKSQGVPGVINVYAHPVTNGTVLVVQIQKAHEGHPKQVAAALWGSGASMFRYKIVIVVDEDIDATDYEAIEWAVAYRVRPGSDDVVVFPGSFGSPTDPSTPMADRSLVELGTGLWNRLLIDATKTWRFEKRAEWGNAKFPPTVENTPGDRERVKQRWEAYHFSDWSHDF